MGEHRLRTAGRWLLGGALTLAGTSHLTTAREEFRAQVPDWIPVDPDLVVLLTSPSTSRAPTRSASTPTGPA